MRQKPIPRLNRGELVKNLPNMAIFAHVVAASSYTQAARDLRLSQSKVSKAISALESSLGIQLCYRTTHSLTLTDEGRAFNERCLRIVAEAEAAEHEALDRQGAPRGTLRVSMPTSIGMMKSDQLLLPFMRRYPELNVDIEVSDSFVDVVKDGYDLVVRVTSDLGDSSLIARRIATSDLYIVASPDYCERNGCPKTVQDLADHNCVIYRWNICP